MGTEIKLIIFILGLLFVGYVLYLLVKKRINERNSFFWLAGSLVILILATMPDILDRVAELAGVSYPPTLLFLLSILVILGILLYQSIQISILQKQCRELTQYLAIFNLTEKEKRDNAAG